jgi:hypothetical protein
MAFCLLVSNSSAISAWVSHTVPSAARSCTRASPSSVGTGSVRRQAFKTISGRNVPSMIFQAERAQASRLATLTNKPGLVVRNTCKDHLVGRCVQFVSGNLPVDGARGIFGNSVVCSNRFTKREGGRAFTVEQLDDVFG